MKKVYVIAAVLTILTAIAIYQFATYLEQINTPKDIEKVLVAVAAVDIPKDTILTDDMLQVISLPKDSVLDGTCSSTDQLLGRITSVPYVAKEQLLVNQTAVQGEASNNRLAYELQDDEFAATIAVDTVSGVGGYVKEGDFITLMVSDTNDLDPNKDVIPFLEHIRVIRVSECVTKDSAEYNTLTLVLKKSDATTFEYYRHWWTIDTLLETSFQEEH